MNLKSKIVFKMEGNPQGYLDTFAPDCKVEIVNKKGPLYLNYGKRHLVGLYDNLRLKGEVLIADIGLSENGQAVEERLEFAISGNVLKRNEKNECTLFEIDRVVAIMHNKF